MFGPAAELAVPSLAKALGDSDMLVRLNAAARQNGMTYGQLINGLKQAQVELDRKVLADIAVRDPETFRRFVDSAREASEAAA